MTVTQWMIWYICMTVAVLTVTVVGTLSAADLLHRSRTSDATEERPVDAQLEQPEDPATRRVPEPTTDHEDPPHGRAA